MGDQGHADTASRAPALRTRCSTSGSTRRLNTSVRPSNGPKATGGDWERWWRTDKGADDVTYIQVMGKDNVAFHTVSFPVTIMGSQEPWKLVDRLKAFNWVTWYGGKFSTSEKRGIFMDQALEHSAERLLALVSDGERAGELRRGVHA